MRSAKKALVAGATLAAALSTNATASADEAGVLAAWDCSPAMVCLFDGTSGTGGRVEVSPTCTGINLGINGLNDRADSLRNRTSRTVYFYSYVSNDNWTHIHTLGSGKQFTLSASERNRIDLVSTCTQ